MRTIELNNDEIASLGERLWRHVKRGSPKACWNWDIKRATVRGYGVIRVNKVNVLAHRAAWMITHGPIKDGLWVLHKCDNPPCCNPAHLFLGTQKDNMKDCVDKGRQSRGERNGHALLSDQKVIDSRRLWLGGTHISQLAKRYKVSDAAIYDAIHGNRWNHVKEYLNEISNNPRKDTAIGVRSGVAKLADVDIIRIRCLHASGMAMAKIGSQFSVTAANVCSIVHRQTWRHVG